MNKNNNKKEFEDLEMQKNVYKDLYETYSELFTTSCGELKFERLQVDALVNTLNEVEVLTGNLERSIINNTLERHYLDKIIHAKLLFQDKEDEE